MLALRGLTKQWLPALARATSQAPSVYDKLVTLTVVDKLGRRHTIRGVEGQNMVEVLEANAELLGDDVVCLSPEGRGKWEAHIKVPTELVDRVPLTDRDDILALEQVADPKTLNEHSRLASRVVLSKELNGTLIAIADVAPWKTL